jgi:hypothetical protein
LDNVQLNSIADTQPDMAVVVKGFRDGIQVQDLGIEFSRSLEVCYKNSSVIDFKNWF